MENKEQSYFNTINISSTRAEGEDFEIYKTRRNFTNKLIKEYLKGRMFYSCYQTVNLTKDSNGKELEKPKRVTVRMYGPYINKDKNDKN